MIPDFGDQQKHVESLSFKHLLNNFDISQSVRHC
jgi:hypothetical protein